MVVGRALGGDWGCCVLVALCSLVVVVGVVGGCWSMVVVGLFALLKLQVKD